LHAYIVKWTDSKETEFSFN